MNTSLVLYLTHFVEVILYFWLKNLLKVVFLSARKRPNQNTPWLLLLFRHKTKDNRYIYTCNLKVWSNAGTYLLFT